MMIPRGGINFSDSATGAELQSTSNNATHDAAQPSNKAEGAAARNVSCSEKDEKVNEMVEALETLILEAYSNMQIDGEYICLPDKVAEKLHRVVEQIQDSCEQEQTENSTINGEDNSSKRVIASRLQEGKLQLETVIPDRPEPEKEHTIENLEGSGHRTKISKKLRDPSSEKGVARMHKVRALQAEVAKPQEEKHNRQISRVASSENIFTQLLPVPEIDKSASSEPPSPLPPNSCSHSGTNTPKVKIYTSMGGQGYMSPVPAPSSVAGSPIQSETLVRTRTPDQTSGSKRHSKILTNEMRRNAAVKMKEDRKMRELRIRESARTQREKAKRQLEEVQQREMEEKRERVRRIREERLHRRTGKATGSDGTKHS